MPQTRSGPSCRAHRRRSLEPDSVVGALRSSTRRPRWSIAKATFMSLWVSTPNAVPPAWTMLLVPVIVMLPPPVEERVAGCSGRVDNTVMGACSPRLLSGQARSGQLALRSAGRGRQIRFRTINFDVGVTVGQAVPAPAYILTV